MAFTDESTVRTHSGWDNTSLVSSALVTQRIDDAHEALLEALDPAYSASTDELLQLAETEIATAFLLLGPSRMAYPDPGGLGPPVGSCTGSNASRRPRLW